MSEMQDTATQTGPERGRETLDQILRRHAATEPDKLALADFANRDGWTTGAAQALTYDELDRRVEIYAAFFAMLGLHADTVVAVQMPPTTDAVIALLALSRAGLIAAPMPLALREGELTDRLALMGARAIVTQAEVLGEPLGIRMRDVAAELFNIRFVFCAGDKVPDGLVELERVLGEAGDIGPVPDIQRRGNPADHPATLAHVLSRRDGATHAVVLPRSHNHWLAAGLMTGIEAAIDADAVIVSPYALSGLKGIGVGLMPWLIAGATLVIGLPEGLAQMVEEARRHAATHVIVPASLAARLAAALDRTGLGCRLIVVNDGGEVGHGEIRHHRVTDVTVLGDLGIIAHAWRAEDHQSIALGTIRTPSHAEQAPVLIETRLQAQEKKAGEARATVGELTLRGPMVPDKIWQTTGRGRAAGGLVVHKDGFVASGLMASLVSTTPARLVVTGPMEDRAGIGPLEVDLGELDRLYQSIGGVEDAAAITLPGSGGQRLGVVVVPKPGAAFDAADYLGALSELALGHHRMPERVFAVPAIARAASGRVMRSGMAARLAPEM